MVITKKPLPITLGKVYEEVEAMIEELDSRVADTVNAATPDTGAGSKALLVTGAEADDNAIEFEATEKGSLGNNISVILVDPAGDDQSLDITVTESFAVAEISISLATGPAGAITSLASEVIDAVNLDADASKYVLASDSGDSDGSGVVEAEAEAFLEGGVDEGHIGYEAHNALVTKVNQIITSLLNAGLMA